MQDEACPKLKLIMSYLASRMAGCSDQQAREVLGNRREIGQGELLGNLLDAADAMHDDILSRGMHGGDPPQCGPMARSGAGAPRKARAAPQLPGTRGGLLGGRIALLGSALAARKPRKATGPGLNFIAFGQRPPPG